MGAKTSSAAGSLLGSYATQGQKRTPKAKQRSSSGEGNDSNPEAPLEVNQAAGPKPTSDVGGAQKERKPTSDVGGAQKERKKTGTVIAGGTSSSAVAGLLGSMVNKPGKKKPSRGAK